MRTEILLFTRPNNGTLTESIDLGYAEPGWSQRGLAYSTQGNPNISNTMLPFRNDVTGNGYKIDLYDDIDIPLNYYIADIREPDKTKTSWSKTITIPGTQNNNRIFQHIYQISGDGWIKIGNTYVYQNFNPNLRREIIINSDGVQVLKGNLQLKAIRKDSLNNIEYDIIAYGDVTSLFFDVGESKLSDLNFSEWNHSWDSDTISKSWNGINLKNGSSYFIKSQTETKRYISKIEPQVVTNRSKITTTTPHLFTKGDFVDLEFTSGYDTVAGSWVIMEVISIYQFTINQQFPASLRTNYNIPTGVGFIYKSIWSGEGYTYPLISWGDEVDYNSFPVTSMAPAYFMKGILDKIFKEIGSSYESNFLNSQFFKRQILVQKKTAYELSLAEITSRSFKAYNPIGYDSQVSYFNGGERFMTLGFTNSGVNSNWNATGSAPSLQVVRYPFTLEVDGANGSTSSGNWNFNTWTVSDSSDYSLKATYQLESWVDINGQFGEALDGTQSIAFGVNRPNTFAPYFGNTTYASGQLNGPLGKGPKTRVTAQLNILRNGQIIKKDVSTTIFDMAPGSDSSQNMFNGFNSGLADNYETNWKLSLSRYQPNSWLNRTLIIDCKSVFLKKGDQVYITLSQYCQSVGSDVPGYNLLFKQTYADPDPEQPYTDILFRGKWLVRVRPNADIYNVPSSKATEGSDILGTDFLPKDMTSKEFLKNVIKMFNLHIEPYQGIEKKEPVNNR